jgi:hypothetical protein
MKQYEAWGFRVLLVAPDLGQHVAQLRTRPLNRDSARTPIPRYGHLVARRMFRHSFTPLLGGGSALRAGQWRQVDTRRALTSSAPDQRSPHCKPTLMMLILAEAA